MIKFTMGKVGQGIAWLMITWEIHKYFDGYTIEKELKSILTFKFDELLKLFKYELS